MKWSLKLGKLLGIDVYLHFTFLLLLAFFGFVYWRATQNVEAALRGVAFIVALFGCVVLHELGHASMARRYGIKTRDITLLTLENISEMIMVNAAMEHQRAGRSLRAKPNTSIHEGQSL
jgi:Zn-dependent protease